MPQQQRDASKSFSRQTQALPYPSSCLSTAWQVSCKALPQDSAASFPLLVKSRKAAIAACGPQVSLSASYRFSASAMGCVAAATGFESSKANAGAVTVTFASRGSNIRKPGMSTSVCRDCVCTRATKVEMAGQIMESFSDVWSVGILDELKALVAEQSESQEDLASRAGLQDFTALPNYLSKEWWQKLESRAAGVYKLELLTNFAATLGLKNPTEASYGTLGSIVLLCGQC